MLWNKLWSPFLSLSLSLSYDFNCQGTQCFVEHTIVIIQAFHFTSSDYSSSIPPFKPFFLLSWAVTIQASHIHLWPQSPLNFLSYDYKITFPSQLWLQISFQGFSQLPLQLKVHLLFWLREGSENALTLVIFLGTKLHEEGDHYKRRIILGL